MSQSRIYYWRLIASYWKSSRSLHDFLILMRIRLAQSKVGKWVCPNRIERKVSLKQLGRDVFLRSHTTDISVLSELIVSHGYDPLLDAIHEPPDTIVDLGANIGLVSRWFLQRFPGAQIAVVEPESGNYSVIEKNLKSFGGQVTLFNGCIGSWERMVDLDTSLGEWGNRMVEPKSDEDVEGLCPVITMNALLQRAGFDTIDVLKCDVEGAEEELFSSCQSWIERVKMAVVEVHGKLEADWLVEELARNGTTFEIVHLERNPGYHSQVVTLKRIGTRA